VNVSLCRSTPTHQRWLSAITSSSMYGAEKSNHNGEAYPLLPAPTWFQSAHSPNRHDARCRWAGADRVGHQMNTTMKHRKLRIAWSVAWGIAAVLLCLLWARSYGHLLEVRHWHGYGETRFYSLDGRILFDNVIVRTLNIGFTWHSGGEKIGEPYLDEWIVNPQKFRSERSWKWTIVVFPHWLPVVVCGTFAAIPWTPWIPWSNRFSLRTLLIAMTLLAVGLGSIIVLSR
jgi:hypothetical protein